MHFVQPAQLLDIFQALEEQNLFLIQNSQVLCCNFACLQNVPHCVFLTVSSTYSFT